MAFGKDNYSLGFSWLFCNLATGISISRVGCEGQESGE